MGMCMRLMMVLMVGLLSLSGCAGQKNSGPIERLSESEAESLNAQHARFEASEDSPIHPETRFAAGALAESQGKPRIAIEQYRAALRIDPHHQSSLYRLGVVYAQMGAYPEAIATWKQYLKQTDGQATAWANLGFCYELAGEPENAEAAYKEGIAKDPKNNPCRVNYGLMLARAGRTTEAIIQLQAVLGEAQVHYNLGSVYEQQGRREQAKAEYRKAAELEPGLQEAKARLAAME